MTPVSIRDRAPVQTDAISRQFRATKLRTLFAEVESQLTDPVLIGMTRSMRDTVPAAPEFAEPELSATAQEILSFVRPDIHAWRLYYLLRDDMFPDIGQELLDAGLVARTIHADGRTPYRLTAAGKGWRAAC